MHSEAELAWPAPRLAWRVVAILTFAYAIAFVHRIGMSLLVGPMQRDLQLSDTQIGLLTGVLFAVPYMAGGPLFGWLGDRGNRRRIVLVASAAWSLATAACGLLTSFASLAAARVGLGLSQAALQPAAASMIADCFPANVRPRAYGVFITATAAGTTAAYWLGALAIGIGEVLSGRYGIRDWSGAFLALGAIGLLAPIAVSLVREPARRERATTGRPSVGDTLGFLRSEALVVTTLCCGVAVVVMAPYGQLAFMPVMFSRQYGWDPADLAVAFGAIVVVAGIPGSISAGWVSAWLARNGRPHSDWIVCFIGALGSLVPGAFAPLMPTAETSLMMFALAGLFANWASVGALGVIARLGPNEMRGQLTAVYTSTVGLIGAGLGPLTVGALSDGLPAGSGGVATALSITFALCAVVSALLLGAGWRRYARLVAPGSGPALSGV